MSTSTIIKIIAFLSFLIFIFQPFSQTLAKTNELIGKEQLQVLGFSQYESVNPNSLLYHLKRLGEKTILFFLFDADRKGKYNTYLLNIRFKELIYIINFEKTGFLTETINRYNVFVAKTKSYYKNTDSNSQNIKNFVNILEKLRDMYPSNSAYWLSIQQAIDSTRNLQ